MPSRVAEVAESAKARKAPPARSKGRKPETRRKPAVARMPGYLLHAPTGQARVVIGGRTHYLGAYDSPASWEAYHALLAEWRRTGEVPPTKRERAAAERESQPPLTLAEALLAYVEHAETYYRGADGAPTTEVARLKRIVRILRETFGRTEAAAFTPARLKESREKMIELGWCRSRVNADVGRVRRMFRWLADEGLVPHVVWSALAAVRPLAANRSAARETEPVGPVAPEVVAATAPHLTPTLRRVVQVQLASGCRPGEALRLTLGEIDRSGAVWIATPTRHKTAWRGKEHRRVILLDAAAQGAILAHLTEHPKRPDEPIFAPTDAAEDHRRRRRESRKTAASSRASAPRTAAPRRRPGAAYTTQAYARAIARAAARAKVSHWHPHQLRHLAGTVWRERIGVEAAMVLLGHRSLSATEIYAASSLDKARGALLASGPLAVEAQPNATGGSEHEPA